jgi:hypothetical protein
MVSEARPRVLLAERSIAPLLRSAESFRELVSKHGRSALGFVFGSFVLNYVPVLGENVVFDTENGGHSSVDRQTRARIPTVNDDEISLGDDRDRFILQRWLNALSVLNRVRDLLLIHERIGQFRHHGVLHFLRKRSFSHGQVNPWHGFSSRT